MSKSVSGHGHASVHHIQLNLIHCSEIVAAVIGFAPRNKCHVFFYRNVRQKTMMQYVS